MALTNRDYVFIVGVAIIMALVGPLGPVAQPIAKKPLPTSGGGPAAKLPKALAAAAAKHGVQVRASLFSAELEELYGYNLEGVPEFMSSIARDKARAVLRGKELKAPGLLATGMLYMLPWVLGLTNEMAVLGSVRVKLPGMAEPGVFVVNGAPDASTDLEIAEEALDACGFKRKDGIWRLVWMG